MSGAKHTPGPWVRSLGPRFDVRVGDPFTGRGIANTVNVGNVKGKAQLADRVAECRANADLIAAAPDMLEALQSAAELAQVACGMTGCRSDDEYVWGIRDKIGAAIAKAEGRS